MHSVAMVLIALALLAGTPAAATPAEAHNSFVVVGAKVFDGAELHPPTNVIVRDGLIVAIGTDPPLPDDLPQLQGKGATLLPGFIDSHVHVFPGAQADALRFGVTTALDMYHLGGRDSAAAFKAQRTSLSKTREADTFTSLTGVTPPGGHPSQMASGWGVEIPTLAAEDDVDAFVRERIEAGADYIKIMQDDSTIGETELVAFGEARLGEIIRAVHAHQRLAIVHVSTQEQARQAFAQGADMIAHVFQDKVADDELLALALKNDAAVITTLSVLARAAGTEHADTLSAHPKFTDHLSSFQSQTLGARFPRERPQLLGRILESIGRFHAAGVPVLAGSDAPNPGTAHGASIHQELELLVAAGLSPKQALHAATALPARLFGLDDRGRIAPGMRADLLLVAGDPTEDILQTRELLRIWKNGYGVQRALSDETP
ncbi:MAG: amidohydrolase family protein [Gammaproteobacteria bacterium]|nr:amidohydrolase family protein [Gammaproteobacteria bacterium]